MGRNNILFPGVGHSAPAAPQQMVIAQPMNDVQLVSWIAAELHGCSDDAADVAGAVQLALEIVAEAAVRIQDLGAMVREKQRKREQASVAPEG